MKRTNFWLYFSLLLCCTCLIQDKLHAQGYYGSEFQSARREIEVILQNPSNSEELKAKSIMDQGRSFIRKKMYKEADSIFGMATKNGLENTTNLYYHRARANAKFFFEEREKNPLKFNSPERRKAMQLYEGGLVTSVDDYKKESRTNLQELEKKTLNDIYDILASNSKLEKNEQNLELANDLVDLYLKHYPKAYPYEWRNRKKELNQELRDIYLSIANGYQKLMLDKKDETYVVQLGADQYRMSKAKKYYELATNYADKALALDIYDLKTKNYISRLQSSYGQIESDKKTEQLIVQEQKFENSRQELSSVKEELIREKEVLDSLLGSKDELIQEVEVQKAELAETVKVIEEYKEQLGQSSILLENQKLINWIISIVAVLILALLIIAFRGFVKQREQNKIIEKNRNEIHLQHREITDSIVYAKRIQSAIMPPMKLIREYLPESFIFYEPKDVVAGDFYWMLPAEKKSDPIIFAAADCTGHGVPGAMVSVVCNSALNRSVKEFGLQDPGDILNKTRELVIDEFSKSAEEVRDGMDIALCSLRGRNLLYAGANNPLWIMRKDADEVEIITAHKQSIGLASNTSPFPTHNVLLNEGDSFYIFSDGYADQFGGENGKKLKAPNFRKFLLSIQAQSMEEQLHSIARHFHSWKQDLDQIDDVCVVGVRV